MDGGQDGPPRGAGKPARARSGSDPCSGPSAGGARPGASTRRWRGRRPGPTGSRRPWSRRAGRGSRGCSRRSGGGSSGMGMPAGRYQIEAMREAVRWYGHRAPSALRPLTARARRLGERLGTRALASARGLWRWMTARPRLRPQARLRSRSARPWYASARMSTRQPCAGYSRWCGVWRDPMARRDSIKNRWIIKLY
jgi:hypothetical protein